MTSNLQQAVSVPEPMTQPLRDARYLVEQIAKVTERELGDVAKALLQEHHALGSTVASEIKQRKLPRYTWSDGLVDFYRETDAFLFETTVWNRTDEKNQMRKWIGEYLAQESTPQRILTFGDGLGFDSLYLALAGHQVDYFEVSDDGGSFAQQIAADAGATVRILSDSSEMEKGNYDVVVCLDVLEHVPDPTEVVGQLSRSLREGGRLFVHAPFWYIAPSVATHLRSNKKYSGDTRHLYEPSGLHPIDGDFFWNPLVLEKRGSQKIENRKSLSWKQRFGGSLLKTARLCSFPHRAYWKWSYSRSWQRWKELEDLCAELNGTESP